MAKLGEDPFHGQAFRYLVREGRIVLLFDGGIAKLQRVQLFGEVVVVMTEAMPGDEQTAPAKAALSPE